MHKRESTLIYLQELVLKIAYEMETRLVFKTGKIIDLETRLKELATALDGFRRSFQCIPLLYILLFFLFHYLNLYFDGVRHTRLCKHTGTADMARGVFTYR